MTRRISRLISSKAFIFLFACAIKAYSATLRLKIENEEAWLTYCQNGGKVLLCAWHQQFASFICYFQKWRAYRPSIMISKSTDGDLIAGIAGHMGWNPVRGSSSKRGYGAVKEMLENLEDDHLGGHVLDGPRGPMGKVKQGAIYMANASGARIVPVYATPENAWFFRKAWDQFFLPKPFSKVTIRYGDMIEYPETEDADRLEEYRLALETLMTPALHRMKTG